MSRGEEAPHVVFSVIQSWLDIRSPEWDVAMESCVSEIDFDLFGPFLNAKQRKSIQMTNTSQASLYIIVFFLGKRTQYRKK